MAVTPDDVFGPDPIDALMDRAGLTRCKLVKELAAKLKAKEVKVFKSTITAKDEETGVLVTESEIIYSKELNALSIQLQALDMALKLRRMYPDPKLDVNLKQPITFEVVDRHTATDEDADPA